MEKLAYNAIGYLPEAQLRILADAEEWGSVLPNTVGEIEADEQTLIDAGFLRVKTVRGLVKLSITARGLKVAPKRRALMARWQRFSALAPLACMAIEDNTGATFAEHGIDFHNSELSVLMRNVGSLESIEDTFGEGYPDEVSALRDAGLI